MRTVPIRYLHYKIAIQGSIELMDYDNPKEASIFLISSWACLK